MGAGGVAANDELLANVERRLDLVETRWYCQGLGIAFAEFVAKFDAAVGSSTAAKRSAPRRAK
jgi:hypothetical protein